MIEFDGENLKYMRIAGAGAAQVGQVQASTSSVEDNENLLQNSIFSTGMEQSVSISIPDMMHESSKVLYENPPADSAEE